MNATGSIVTIPDSDDSFETIVESLDGSRKKLCTSLRRDDICAIYVQHHCRTSGKNFTSAEAHNAQKLYGKALREIDLKVENKTSTNMFGKGNENTSTDKKTINRESSAASPMYISGEYTVSEPVANLTIELDQKQNEGPPPKILSRRKSHFDSLEVCSISSDSKRFSILHQEPSENQLTADDSSSTSKLKSEQPSTSSCFQPIASTEIEHSKPTNLKRKCDDDYLSDDNLKQMKSDSGVLSSSIIHSKSSNLYKKETGRKSSSRRDSVKPLSSLQHSFKDSYRNEQEESSKPSSSNVSEKSSRPLHSKNSSSRRNSAKPSSSPQHYSEDSSHSDQKESSKQSSLKDLAKNDSKQLLYKTVLKNALARHSTSPSNDSLGTTLPKTMGTNVIRGVTNLLKEVNIFGPMITEKHYESPLKKYKKKQHSKKISSELVDKNVSTSKSKAASTDEISKSKHKPKSVAATQSNSKQRKSINSTKVTDVSDKQKTNQKLASETKAVRVAVSVETQTVDEIGATVKVGVTVGTQTDDQQLENIHTIVKSDACQLNLEQRDHCEQTNIQTSQNDVPSEAVLANPVKEELQRTIIELQHTIAGLNTSRNVVAGILNDYVADCKANHVMKEQKESLQKQTISEDQTSTVTSPKAEASNLHSTSVATIESKNMTGSSSSTTSSRVVVNSVAQNSIAQQSSVSSQLTSMESITTISMTHPVNQRYRNRNSVTAVTMSQENSPISSLTTLTAPVISVNSVSCAVPVQQQLSVNQPGSSQVLITTPNMHWTVPVVFKQTQNSNTTPVATTSSPLVTLGNAFSVIPTSTVTTTSTINPPFITPHMLIPRQPQRVTLIFRRNTCTGTNPSKKPTAQPALQINTHQQQQQSLQKSHPIKPFATNPYQFQIHSGKQCVQQISTSQIQPATNTMLKTTTQRSQQLQYQQCQPSPPTRITTRSQTTFMTKQQFQNYNQLKQLLQNAGSTNVSMPQSLQQPAVQLVKQISNAKNQKLVLVVNKMPVTLGQSQQQKRQLKEQQLKEQQSQEQICQEQQLRKQLRDEQLRQQQQQRQKQLREEQLRQVQLRQEQQLQEQQRQEEQHQEEGRQERLKEQRILDELKRDNERLQNEKIGAIRLIQQSARNRNLEFSIEPDFWCVKCSAAATLICKTCFGFASCSRLCCDILHQNHLRTCSAPNIIKTSDLKNVQQR